MAICNLFRRLSKNTGNVMVFSQYSEDLTQCFTQHDSYDISPSRFVALNIDYSHLRNSITDDLNVELPTYLQNQFENGCAWLRSNAVGESWNPTDWTPDYSTNLFWNSLLRAGLISVGTKTVEDGTGEITIRTIPEIKYVGNIDIHSYEQRDGVGYNEIYCYIPNAAEETYYQVDFDAEALEQNVLNEKVFIEGYTDDDENILGILNLRLKDNEDAPSTARYHYMQSIGSEFTEPLQTSSTGDDARFEYNTYPVGTDSFKFNTIVVLYDIMVRDADANISTAYKNVPMAMFLTGTINDDGTVNNEVLKYSHCDDAYGSGTSYGLRICTRYMITPNATTLLSSEADIKDQYAGFSRAMSAMAESQDKMNDILSGLVGNAQDIKNHLAMFKNYRTNIPYVIFINENGIKTPYWFVNGKNTNVKVSEIGSSGKDGATPELQLIDGEYHWTINGRDTGIVGQGRDGINGDNGTWWFHGTELNHELIDNPGEHVFVHGGITQREGDFYLNTDTGAVYVLKRFMNQTGMQWEYKFNLKGLRGDDGFTPTAQPNPQDHNRLWWYVGNTPVCIAEAENGKSILCITDSDVAKNDADPTTFGVKSSKANIGDLVIYVGRETDYISKYDLCEVTENTFTKVTTSYRVLSKQSNIQGKQITGIRTFEGKKATFTHLNFSDGRTVCIKTKHNYTSAVRFSSLQRKFAHMEDVVYYRPGDEMYVEVPYVLNGEPRVDASMIKFRIEPYLFKGDLSRVTTITSGMYINKNKKNGSTQLYMDSSNGPKSWTPNMEFGTTSDRWGEMKSRYDGTDKGNVKRKDYSRKLGNLHLFISLHDYCQAMGMRDIDYPCILKAVYSNKIVNGDDQRKLKWTFDKASDTVSVLRHGLIFNTPNDWGRINGGNNVIANSAFHKYVISGKHQNALTSLLDMKNAGSGSRHISPIVWIKTPTNHALSKKVGNGEKALVRTKWRWLNDKYVHKKRQDREATKIRYRMDWASAAGFVDILKLDKFIRFSKSGSGAGTLYTPKHRPYLYFALFDKVGTTGYLYKLIASSVSKTVVSGGEPIIDETSGEPTGELTPIVTEKSVNTSGIRIVYQGRIPYPKKTV